MSRELQIQIRAMAATQDEPEAPHNQASRCESEATMEDSYIPMEPCTRAVFSKARHVIRRPSHLHPYRAQCTPLIACPNCPLRATKPHSPSRQGTNSES